MSRNTMSPVVPISQITQSHSTGLVYGMALSINADNTKFDVSPGRGYCVDNTTNPLNPTIKRIDFGGLETISVTNIATQLVTYVSIDVNGDIVQESSLPEEEERRTNVFLGVVVHTNNTTIEVVNNTPCLAIDTDGQLQDLMNSLGLFNIRGNAIRAFGGNLQIIKTAGTIFRVGSNFQVNPKIPHSIILSAQSPITNIQYRTQTGSTYDPSGVLDPMHYDLNGVRTTLANTSKATNQRVYIFPSGYIRIQYGQKEYSSISAALEGLSNETFVVEPNLQENALLLATISLRGGASDLSLVADAIFTPAGKWGDVSNTGSTAVGTLQQIYNNSVTKPQIIISSLQAVEISDENNIGSEVARFGKISAGNYSSFEADGTLRFKGNGTVWRDENIGGISLTPGSSNQPALTVIPGTTILSRGFSSSQQNDVHGAIEIQHDYLEGSDIVPHVHWYPNNTNTGNVLWELEYWIRRGNTILLYNTITVLSPGGGVTGEAIRADFPTINGATIAIAAQMHMRVSRLGNNGSDTYTDLAIIGTFGIHYQVDGMGSRQIMTK